MGHFLFEQILDLFFPKLCLGCKCYGSFFCGDCEQKLLINPLQVTRLDLTIDTLYDYHEGIHSKVLESWKYYGQTFLLKKMLVHLPQFSNYDCVIPVPLHKARIAEKGFSPPRELAKLIGEAANIPVADVLVRVKRTKQQASLSQSERRENIQNAFKQKKSLKGKRILLVDDVVTTGSTLLECKRILEQQGNVVSGFCLMRSELHANRE